MANLAEAEINRLQQSKHLNNEEHEFLLTYFNARHRVLEGILNKDHEVQRLEKARLKVLKTQRKQLLHLWESHEINDKQLNQLEREIDVAEAYSARGALK